MTRILIVTFDLIRNGESPVAYSAASLLARLRTDHRHNRVYTVDHAFVNVLAHPPAKEPRSFQRALGERDLAAYDVIAVSAYIWADTLVNPFLEWARQCGFRGRIVVGGYQITGNAGAARRMYPLADVFLTGFAEESLLDAVLLPRPPELIRREIEFSQLPSPYLAGVIPVADRQPMVRMETRRGCPYACSFCRHRDVDGNRVHAAAPERVRRELEFFHAQRVGKINVLDPVFNSGRQPLAILDHMIALGMTARIALQCRFETVTEDFLDRCEQLDVHLEFGVQTIDAAEARLIDRPNNIARIDSVMRELAIRGISYEVSLIYGLPRQTPGSFARGIEWLQARECPTIKAFPLMLLPGTPLHQQRGLFGLRTRIIGEYRIPHVVESDSFSEDDWAKMHELAESLSSCERIA